MVIVNPLQPAHDAVQARKQATGMPMMADVVAGDVPPPGRGEAQGLFLGTNLTEEDVFEATEAVCHGIAQLVLSGAATARAALGAAYMEGLLTGIEHGRRVGGS